MQFPGNAVIIIYAIILSKTAGQSAWRYKKISRINIWSHFKVAAGERLTHLPTSEHTLVTLHWLWANTVGSIHQEHEGYLSGKTKWWRSGYDLMSNNNRGFGWYVLLKNRILQELWRKLLFVTWYPHKGMEHSLQFRWNRPHSNARYFSNPFTEVRYPRVHWGELSSAMAFPERCHSD